MKMKRLLAGIVLVSVLGIMLGGCRESPMPTESPLVSVSPYSAPTVIPIPYLLPTPAADMATAGGRLVRVLGDSNGEPMANTRLLLATVIRSEDGTPIVAAASEETSSMVVTDENGVFVFTDVAPNTYGIAVVTPLGSFLLKDKHGDNILFTVQAGMVLDLGEIYTTLPY